MTKPMTAIDKLSCPLLVLAERCEAATGPDRKLDGDIHVAIFGKPGDRIDWAYAQLVEHYTASLDAAMTLVPEGWSVTLFIASKFKSTRCALAGNGETVDAAANVVSLATAPALALCAAALRAKAGRAS